MVERRAPAVLVVLLCLWGGGVPSGALVGAVECPTMEGVGRSVAEMPSAVVDIQKAESSQRRHLEALFNRYGENGTLTLASLKSLLHNIGLDRVRNVTVQYSDHPHGDNPHGDHPHGDHPHDDHPHGDADAHNLSLKLTDSRPSTAARLSDSHEQQAPSPGRGPSAGHRRRRADGNGTTRSPGSGPPGTGTSTLSGKGLDGDHHQDHDDHDDPHHDHNDHDDHHHDHDDHHQDPLDQVHRDHPPHHHGHNQDTDHQDHDHHNGHHALGVDDPDTLSNHSLSSTECQNASEVLWTHGMARNVALSPGDFRYLCPALLHQISSGSCILHRDPARRGATGNDSHTHNHGNHDHEDRRGDSRKSVATAWAGGFVSITVISLLSLLGVVLIPLMNKVFFNFLLSFLVALAVGTLSGDAFLHLIPHSQATHHLHHHHNHHEVAGPEVAGQGLHSDQEENLDGVWKGLTALSGVYVMFLIEHFLTLGKMYKDRKKVQKKWDSHDKDLEEVPALEENHLKPHEDAEANGGGALAEEQQLMLAPAESAAAATGHARPPDAAYTDQDCEHKCHSHFHDTVGQSDHHHHHDYHHILHHHHSQNHHPHSHAQSYSQEHFEQVGVAALAWMVIMGDGLHNFSDGLAIGAAFSEGLSSGLSTSVAVFCHELPHELGDFAVLLKSGMTVRQAILYNVLSAMMAYLGMGVGIVIGHYAENVSMWIFALTAGLFMYVALVDMMPEMLHNNAGEQGVGHCGFFLLQNAGILLGFAIMLLIAVFEHKIQLDLD